LKLKDAKIHTRFIKIGIGGNVLEKENMVTTKGSAFKNVKKTKYELF
jgi:hypothetical protein